MSIEEDMEEITAQARELIITSQESLTFGRLERLQAWLANNAEARSDPSGPGGNIEITGVDSAVVAGQLVCDTDDVDGVQHVLAVDFGVENLQVDQDECLAKLGLVRVTFEGAEVVQVVGGCRERGLSSAPLAVTSQAQWTFKAEGSPSPTNRTLLPRSEGPMWDSVKVAVIDGGFSQSATQRTDGWLDGVVGPKDGYPPLDVDGVPGLDAGAGHGDFVTGIIRQVAPGCAIHQYRVLNSVGAGSELGLVLAICAALADQCSVINLSVGMAPGAYPALAISRALQMVPANVLVVAAAGNAGSPLPAMAASHKRTIGVGSLDNGLVPSKWSNHGPWVDFSCVGEGVVSTFVDGLEPDGTPYGGTNPIAMWSGTSFTAPQVSGWLAKELARNGGNVGAAVSALRHEAPSTTGFTFPHPEMGYRLRIL